MKKALSFLLLLFPSLLLAQFVPKFDLSQSGLSLQRPTQQGVFFDVLGRKSALFGYENRTMEVWTYPLKLVNDFKVSFEVENYPIPIEGSDIMSNIEVRPEATILTYRHSAFKVRQIIFAPIHEAGVVMLFEVDSVRPMTIRGSLRPALSLMWPAGMQTGNIFWDEQGKFYGLNEETGKYWGMVSVPNGKDNSVMPYQEEPKDVPNQFTIEVKPDIASQKYIPIVFSGSLNSLDEAKAISQKLLSQTQELYTETATYYQNLLSRTIQIATPDERLNTAFSWAKIGMDKGIVESPLLGTGLVAGFRASGNSERPGFAWFFGRDSEWTAFGLNAIGDFESTKIQLNFLKQFQREDGKIPHEISQSAPLVDWFKRYPYAWNSADATPLYVIAHSDYYQSSGDLNLIRQNWDSIKKAWRWSQKTDTDNNGLIENTNFGHGWVEGGELYPPHEEMYMQGLWIEASRNIAQLAEVMNEPALVTEAKAAAERTRVAMENQYWLKDQKYYGYATFKAPVRDFLAEDTVLPSVPMWFSTTDFAKSQQALDHIGGGNLATDWGQRILSNQSKLYDPLAYHYGSVWPLFTGWASLGAYRYNRPHIGYQALMANALLTYQDALGYVTELLSGDFNTAFGRSSHHQVWSEAMVATPLVRGLLGIDVRDGASTLRFAPNLPADWDKLTLNRIGAGAGEYGLSMERNATQSKFVFTQTKIGQNIRKIIFEPAFPLDAKISEVQVNGQKLAFTTEKQGDIQRLKAEIPISAGSRFEILVRQTRGSDVYVKQDFAELGGRSQGLRILSSRAENGALNLRLEGIGGRTYPLLIRSDKAPEGATRLENGDWSLNVTFDKGNNAHSYVQKSLRIALK